jgi:hypothetical protein
MMKKVSLQIIIIHLQPRKSIKSGRKKLDATSIKLSIRKIVAESSL